MSFIPRILMTSDTQQLLESLWMQMPFKYLHFIEDARLREVDGLALGHTARAWQGWNLNSRSLTQVLLPDTPVAIESFSCGHWLSFYLSVPSARNGLLKSETLSPFPLSC